MRPTFKRGNPPESSCQLIPPSVDLYPPSPATAAYRVARLEGSCTTSVTLPVSSGTDVHVSPLLVDRNSPKLVPAKTVELVGEPAVAASTRIFDMVAPPAGVAKMVAPSWRHVAPASVDRSTPQPYDALAAGTVSPVPAYTMLGATGSSATAPIAREHSPSVSGVQFAPASSVLQIPPQAAAA